eukprot:UN34617
MEQASQGQQVNNTGYGGPPPNEGTYGAPPPNYGGPPQDTNYGQAPPQQQQGYGGPPQPQQGYGGPPQQQQNYGAPPQGQQQAGAGLATSVPMFTQLCSCFDNCGYCLWVWCCCECALADLYEATEAGKWWMVFGVLFFCDIMSRIFESIPDVAFLGGIFRIIFLCCGVHFLLKASRALTTKLNLMYWQECDCICCLTYVFCTYCHMCQLGNELRYWYMSGTDRKDPATELLANIQRGRPCCNDNNCIVPIPTQFGNQGNAPQQQQQQNYGQPPPNQGYNAPPQNQGYNQQP